MIVTKSFLQKYTNGPDWAVSLTKVQARLLGLTYPLPRSWLDKAIGKKLPALSVTLFKSEKTK